MRTTFAPSGTRMLVRSPCRRRRVTLMRVGKLRRLTDSELETDGSTARPAGAMAPGPGITWTIVVVPPLADWTAGAGLTIPLSATVSAGAFTASELIVSVAARSPIGGVLARKPTVAVQVAPLATVPQSDFTLKSALSGPVIDIPETWRSAA